MSCLRFKTEFNASRLFPQRLILVLLLIHPLSFETSLFDNLRQHLHNQQNINLFKAQARDIFYTPITCRFSKTTATPPKLESTPTPQMPALSTSETSEQDRNSYDGMHDEPDLVNRDCYKLVT